MGSLIVLSAQSWAVIHEVRCRWLLTLFTKCMEKTAHKRQQFATGREDVSYCCTLKRCVCVIFCSGLPGCFKIVHIICPDWWFDNTSTGEKLYLYHTIVSKLLIRNFKGLPCSNILFLVFTFFNQLIWLRDFNEIHLAVGSQWWVELSKVSLCISRDQRLSRRSQGAAPDVALDQQDLV